MNPSFPGAVIHDEFALKTIDYASDNKTDVKWIKKELITYNHAVSLHGRRFLRKTFKFKLQQLIEGGFFVKWLDLDILTHRSIAEKQIQSEKAVLSLKHLHVGFFMWMLMLLVSFLVFLLEHACYWMLLWKKQRTSRIKVESFDQ